MGIFMELRIKVEAVFEDGRMQEHELGSWKRHPECLNPEAIGLLLEDAHAILSRLQDVAISAQVEEISEVSRACPSCGKSRHIHDYRSRKLETLFGKTTVKAPRLKPCNCHDFANSEISSLSWLTKVFPDRMTPELARLQAELGARHSFREAARLMNQLLPCGKQSHMTLRNRLGRVAKEIEAYALEQQEVEQPLGADGIDLAVFVDGAHIRCRPEYQKRHLDIVVGRIEGPTSSIRFGLETSASVSISAHVRAQLHEAGWRSGQAITVLTDGEPGLANHIRWAVDGRVTHILDWWHISMRIKHLENAVTGLHELVVGRKGADKLPWLAERLRWLIWHGKSDRALKGIEHLVHRAGTLQDLSRSEVSASVKRICKRCDVLFGYIENNARSIPDYGSRHRAGLPVSTSRAEGCVDDLANARMGKKRRMRWSPRGAHRVAITRAAVLDGRLQVSHRQKAA